MGQREMGVTMHAEETQKSNNDGEESVRKFDRRRMPEVSLGMLSPPGSAREDTAQNPLKSQRMMTQRKPDNEWGTPGGLEFAGQGRAKKPCSASKGKSRQKMYENIEVDVDDDRSTANFRSARGSEALSQLGIGLKDPLVEEEDEDEEQEP